MTTLLGGILFDALLAPRAEGKLQRVWFDTLREDVGRR